MVTKDIPPFALAVGNPMVIKSYRFSQEVIAKLLEIEWWNWPDLIVKEAAPILSSDNVDALFAFYEDKVKKWLRKS